VNILTGLAGMSEVAGISHRLHKGLTVGYGYTAIIVAWLGKLNPWGVLVVAILLAGLLSWGCCPRIHHPGAGDHHLVGSLPQAGGRSGGPGAAVRTGREGMSSTKP
jgi:ABC-type uncharacterized transport system permease subunit